MTVLTRAYARQAIRHRYDRRGYNPEKAASFLHHIDFRALLGWNDANSVENNPIHSEDLYG